MPAPENPCLNCIKPCEQQEDGECTGPITEEQQVAINQAIIYEHTEKETAQSTEEKK
jgi:hypothetical protein